MRWEPLGFKDNPLNTDPIAQTTLSLYTGHEDEAAICSNVLHERNVTLVVEGSRGVGTTSFANYLRFSMQEKKLYLTPSNEIRVEEDWKLETLLAAIIVNIIREIELFHPDKIAKDKRFQNAKALSMRIAETYRAFGVEAIGFGVSYGKVAGISSQPSIVPSPVLGHHLEDLINLVQSLGYKYGILVQLNNLDIGEVHSEKHLKYLFNALRDYIQTNGVSWILVGDIGLRKFIAQQVDRLDDIISYEVCLSPMNEKEYRELIEKRIVFYRSNPRATLPIDIEVFLYLYKITKGRLRYVFGLLARLANTFNIGNLTDRITLDIAQPMLVTLARDRIKRNNLSPGEETILKVAIKLQDATAATIAKEAKKSRQYVSKVLSLLAKTKLVTIKREGKNRYYIPVLDAFIAYSALEEEK